MRAEKVVSFLLNDSHAVRTIVGNKIYGGASKQNTTPPLIVYAKQSAERQTPLNHDDDVVVDAIIDVIVVTKTYSELKSLGDAVRIALDYRQNQTIADVNVIETRINDEGPDQIDPDQEEFAQVWSFLIQHTE